MLPRERVLKALNHEEADRVPIYLGGSASKFYISTAKKLMKYFSINENKLELVAAGFKYSPFNEKLWKALDIDVRYIYPKTETNDLYKKQFAEENEGRKYKNIWGGTNQFLDRDGERVNLEGDIPFKKADLSYLDNYNWPKPREELTRGLRKRAELLSSEGQFAIAMYRPFAGGIFSTARYCLRGSVNFFEDLLLNKDFANLLLQKILDVQKEFYRIILNEIGDFTDIVEIEDDLGTQRSLMISPDIYRSIIKPKHKELVELIKQKSPKAKVLMHCDGAIKDVIRDFIEIGIDILNPIQVTADGMGLKDLKREFGKDIVFAGGVDVVNALEGSINDVKNCVKNTVEIMAPNGGYLLGPSHNFGTRVPYENVVAMVNAAKEYGVYS